MPNRQYFNNGGVIGPNNDPQVSAEQITTFTSSGTFNPSGGTASPRNTGGQGKQFDIASPTDSPSQTHYASGGAGGRGSGPPTPGGGSTAAGGNNQGGGGGSHGPVRSGSYSGQGGYAVFKEPGGFAGASGVWTLSEVLDLVAAGNWSSS